LGVRYAAERNHWSECGRGATVTDSDARGRPHRSVLSFANLAMPLKPNSVPEEFRYLLPLAERWGIGDDFDREHAVGVASSEDLSELVSVIRDMPTDALFDWLAGPESQNPRPSEEYLALTCMTMAYHSARVKLKNRQSEQTASPNGGPATTIGDSGLCERPPSVR